MVNAHALVEDDIVLPVSGWRLLRSQKTCFILGEMVTEI